MKSDPQSEQVAVVGLGFLGRGIAACFLGHGFRVMGVELGAEEHGRAREHIGQMIGELIELGGFNPRLSDEWTARYIPCTGFDSLSECSFVVESVTEDLTIKESAIAGIEGAVGEKTVIATNTSAIPISQLQSRCRYPARFVGMHWAEPAHATRFMELIRGEQTSEDAFQAAAAMARRLGKDPSLCQQDVPAFIVNRIGYAMYREALHLLETGVADADAIDRAVRNALGLWATICGPFRWIDLTGGPELYAKAMKGVLPTLSKADDLPPVIQKLADDGARGVANGRGFFNYTPEEARRWQELYRQHAWRVARMQNEYFPLEEEIKR
jgi:3-hydroxybutyryl-CoA dehydrogenase